MMFSGVARLFLSMPASSAVAILPPPRKPILCMWVSSRMSGMFSWPHNEGRRGIIAGGRKGWQGKTGLQRVCGVGGWRFLLNLRQPRTGEVYLRIIEWTSQ